MQQQNKTSVIIAVLLVLVAAISRVLLYPNYNFSPMVGMAIFAGATFTNKKLAFALPIVSMLLSDIMLEMVSAGTGFWGWGQLVGYGIFALITVLAFSLKKISVPKVIGYSLVSSVIFYLLSNLSFFLIDNPVYHTYPQNQLIKYLSTKYSKTMATIIENTIHLTTFFDLCFGRLGCLEYVYCS